MKTEVKRAARCPAAGYGWLYLRQEHASLFNGGPPLQHPDPRQSGQNPAYTEWGIEQLKRICSAPYYQEQIKQRISELERERTQAAAATSASIAELDRIENLIARTSDLIA